jgi:hypothetical protein
VRWSLGRRRRAGSDHRIGPAGRHLSQPLLQADRGSTPAPTLGEHLVGRDGQADDGEAAMPVPERPALTNGGQSARRRPVARIPRRRGVPPGNKGGHLVAPPVSHRRRWSSPWLARPTQSQHRCCLGPPRRLERPNPTDSSVGNHVTGPIHWAQSDGCQGAAEYKRVMPPLHY